MKRFLVSLCFICCLFFQALKVEALNFEEGLSQSSKVPMVALIYANWADGYQSILQKYNSIQPEFLGQYNFVELDIASKDAKFFNTMYHIYPNLPYVLVLRDGGKVSRYIPKSCLEDESCMKSKLKSFIQ